MPNRILRDWTDSEKLNGLDAHTERFLTRLIMKVDDYGRLYANPLLLKANLFPFLLDQITEADIDNWLCNCHNAGLILLYEVDGKKYLQIENFKQRLRLKHEKYPSPTGYRQPVGKGRLETEVETEVEMEKYSTAAKNPPLRGGQGGAGASIDEKIKLLAGRALKFKDALQAFTPEYPEAMLEDFFQYWSECNPSYTKLRFEMEKTWEVQKRLATWAARSKNFKTNGHGQNTNTRKGQPDTGAIRKAARTILERAGAGE